MTKTLTLEADVNSANTATDLTSQGSVTAPSRKLPEGVTRIDKIIACAAADNAADGAAVWFLRLGGTAVQRGEQVIVFAAAGGTTGADIVTTTPHAPLLCMLEDLDIEVIPDVITVKAEMAGDDLGDSIVVVTLVLA